MGLLTICAQHYEGLFWLAAYYGLLATLPIWFRLAQPVSCWRVTLPDFIPMRESREQRIGFVAFVGSTLYVGGTLPCARFYYEGDEGFAGNSLLRVSYQFVYLYLALILH